VRKPRATLVALALLLVTIWSAAGLADVIPSVKGPVQVTARPSTEYRVHDVGTLWSAVSNFGNYGEPNALMPSFEWPAGSEVYYCWEGRLWMAAMVGGEALCSHADYGNYELDPTDGSIFYHGTGPKSIQDAWSRFDDLTDYEGHTSIGLEVSQRSLAWSLTEYDDFIIFYVDVKNVSGGTLNGAFLSWVFDNDVGTGAGGDPSEPHLDDLVDYDGWTHEGENPFRYDIVDPLDLDNDGIDGYDYWGWAVADPRNPFWNGYSPVAGEPVPETDEPEPDGIYDEYQIYVVDNVAEYAPLGLPEPDYIRYQVDVPENGIVAGDPVIDMATGDTLRGYLIPRNMSYMFDGDYPQSGEEDSGERHLSTPVSGFIGTRFLYIPQEPFNTTDDDNYPRPYSHQWWNWESDPGSDSEKYEYMTGTHTLSEGMKFLPHPFDYSAGAPVFDYRYMINLGPFGDWRDGDSKKVVMVTGVGEGLKGLRENLDNAMIAYYAGELGVIGDPMNPPPAGHEDQTGFTGTWPADIVLDGHFLLPIPPPIPTLNYSPGDGMVDLVWDNSAEEAIDNFIGSVDFEGYKIYRSKYNTQNWEMIAAFDLAEIGPTYLKNSAGDTLNPIMVGSEYICYNEAEYEATVTDPNLVRGTDWDYVAVDLPDIVHSYLDDGGDFSDLNDVPIFRDVERPINGLNYFYAVVAYDPAKPDRGLGSIESAKSNYRKALDGQPDAVIPRTDAAPEDNLDNVKVVPNPYKGTALFEARYEDRLSFINLPPRCKITIFSLTGDMIDELYKSTSTTGALYWDLISRNNQKVVSGLYIYVVETPGGEKKIGKFLIIR